MVAESLSWEPGSLAEAQQALIDVKEEIGRIQAQLAEYREYRLAGRADEMAERGRDAGWYGRARHALVARKRERHELGMWISRQQQGGGNREERLGRIAEEESARLAAWQRENGVEDPTALRLLALLRWHIGTWAKENGVDLGDDFDAVMRVARDYCRANGAWPPAAAPTAPAWMSLFSRH